MEKYLSRLNELYIEGQNFTYENFSAKNQYGYTQAIKEEYSSWNLRCKMFLEKLFGDKSPIIEYYKKHEFVRLTGNGRDSFNLSHKYILGALKTGIDTISMDNVLLEDETTQQPGVLSPNVFVVHGHDDDLKKDAEIFLSEIGLNPIVLHRQADEGQTILEKFEKHSEVGYAFVLLTPDDVAYHKSQENLEDDERVKSGRARQNVIFEFGYFVAKLGRNRVCCLYKDGVELPSDISGLIYKQINNKLDEVAYQVMKDLRAVGYKLKL